MSNEEDREYERLVLDEWFKCFNQHQAVNAARKILGWKPVSRQAASVYFGQVRESLRRRTAEKGEHLNEVRLLAVEKLIALLRAKKADAYDKNGKPLPLNKVPLETQALITRVSVKPTLYGDVITYSFAPDTAALKLAMQTAGMMEAFDPSRGEALSQEEADRELDSRFADLEAAIADEKPPGLDRPEDGAAGSDGGEEPAPGADSPAA